MNPCDGGHRGGLLMARRYPSKEAREIVVLARKWGWHQIGWTGKGHPLLQHENGSRYPISATPGDRRSRANALAALERIATGKIASGRRAG